MTDKELRWVIVMTWPNAEHDVYTRLRKQGFRPWLWVSYEDESYGPPHHRKTRRVLRPYFPQYLFVRKTRRIAVINDTKGVSTVLREADEGQPLVIPDEAMRELAAALHVEEDGFVPSPEVIPEDVPKLLEGSLFTVAGGPFDSFIATVEKTIPLDGRHKIRALVHLFGGPTPTEFDPEQVGEIVA